MLHALKSLVYFDDISTSDWPEMLLEKNIKLIEIKKDINSKVKLFNKNIG
jgi:hypothetical protein